MPKEKEQKKEYFLPTKWEQRFEEEINALFDEAIDRLPPFVDKYLRSFSKVMRRNLSVYKIVGDFAVGLRNVSSAVTEKFGVKDYKTTTYTEDELAEAFSREVISREQTEELLERLFDEFESDLWRRFEEKLDRPSHVFREHLLEKVNSEIEHDPGLAQVVRNSVHFGIPVTLGFLLRKEKYELTKNGLEITGAVLGSFIAGGLFEYLFNSIRDLKGSYIRKINTKRYILLYGTDPSTPSGRGILHIVRTIERKFDKAPGASVEEFNRWLESCLDIPGDHQNDIHGEVYDYPSDANNVTIEEALNIAYDADIERVDDETIEVVIPAESSEKVPSPQKSQ